MFRSSSSFAVVFAGLTLLGCAGAEPIEGEDPVDSSESAPANGPAAELLIPIGTESAPVADGGLNSPLVVIYVHGYWNLTDKPPTFFTEGNESPAFFPEKWLHSGWDVAMFRWDYLNKEGAIGEAEDKIYTSTGPRGMRYRVGTEWAESDLDIDAAQLLVEQVARALDEHRPVELRFVGHSLGGGLALRAAELAQDRGLAENYRVAMLDPFFSGEEKDYLGGETPSLVAKDRALRLQAADVPVSVYKTSLFADLFGQSGDELLGVATYIRQFAEYFPSERQDRRHWVATTLYFDGMGRPAFDCQDDTVAPSANSTADVVLSHSGGERYWSQSGGTDTVDTSDDCYRYLR